MEEVALRELKLIVGIVLALLATPAALNAQTIPGAVTESTTSLSRGEWPAYAGTYAAAQYSPLTQIDRGNAKDLHIALALEIAGHGDKGQAGRRSELRQ
jgi:glucose dehydrogenase